MNVLNVLIVGNGFDLAHYLPTKYDHFMGVMHAIEEWNIEKGDMKFDDLFGRFYEKEKWFFDYTKVLYRTEDINLTVAQIKDLQQQLNENVWYKYFSDHVKELKTWIDFETKIEEALEVCCLFFEKYEELSKGQDKISNRLSVASDKKGLSILARHKKTLKLLRLLVSNNFFEFHGDPQQMASPLVPFSFKNKEEDFINSDFIYTWQEYTEYKYTEVLDFLYKNMDNLISLFNGYLMFSVSALNPYMSLKNIKSMSDFGLVFSFNYTDTFNRFYRNYEKSSVEGSIVDFVHGRSGLENNIVLGVSDLSNQFLKKHKAYGFVKYHQKLMKNTDYKFILENEKTSVIIMNYGKRVVVQWIKIVFWGHSLDVSDRNYIEEIFNLQDDVDYKVRVLIYFYGSASKFSMLANLIHILGNHKVEKWMKKGWLRFEPVPNIAEVNGIT